MSRDPIYLHPLLAKALPAMLETIQKLLPAGHTVKLLSTYRSQAEQFDLYKQGRTFDTASGKWKRTGATVTNIDGFNVLSNHNYLPCHAFDVGIFKGSTYLGNSPLYKHVKAAAEKGGFEWGGDWASFKDEPHIELQKAKVFNGNRVLDTAREWQKILKAKGFYTGELDGAFGTKSMNALKAATGSKERNEKTWKKLNA
jgi:peptidoglycan L-alanyl-D-glutamate endopeptidase CwlK